ncbi:hypothetical protein [Motilimonas cestriensis]|uniref:hypothetical protein n=1 Tax=Motilimonas cestriensis TaxID=2742685 RepID=UPI003DA1F926
MKLIASKLMAALLASASFSGLAAPLLIANQTLLAVEQLASDTQINDGEWQLVSGDMAAMVEGQIQGLFSPVKWTDQQMAKYVQAYGEKPVQLLLAAKDDQTDVDMARKAELFSGRANKPLVYLYLNKSVAGQVGVDLGARLSSLDGERWQQQGWIAAPAAITQSNQVALGLASAQFEGGYR